MKDHYPLLIIGAGPAGLSAATLAAEQGLQVALVDELCLPGGQVFRSIESTSPTLAKQLGADYQRGLKLVEAFRSSGANYFPQTSVWTLNEKLEIGLIHQNRARIITADQVLIANGAMERPMPFPGWTLPGVMNAGAGQIMFKQHDVVPEDGVVLAGSGPLLLLLAWQYLHAGVKIQALLDTTPTKNLLHALPFLPRALLAHHYITRGFSYQLDLKRAGVPMFKDVTDLQAIGVENLQKVCFRIGRKNHQLETGLLLVHFGVIPNTHLSRAAGCKHKWDKNQQCLRPDVDGWGNSSANGILIAGDGVGIGGARTAEHAGRLAAFEVLYKLGRLDKTQRDRLARDDRKWMQADLHIRPFLEKLFRHPQQLLAALHDDTIVCRCEEVSAGDIRREITSGHRDSNQVKFISRSGMGPCQGRQCAQAVAQIVAAETAQPITADSLYRVRPPVKPLTFGQLAGLYPEESE